MAAYSTTPSWVWRGLSVVLVLLILGLITPRLDMVSQLLNPSPSMIDKAYGDAEILIQVDRPIVWFIGNCTSITWQFEGLKAVYKNDAIVTDTGQQEFCYPTTFLITLEDGSERSYTLAITYEGYEFLRMLTLILIVCLIIALQFERINTPARTWFTPLFEKVGKIWSERHRDVILLLLAILVGYLGMSLE